MKILGTLGNLSQNNILKNGQRKRVICLYIPTKGFGKKMYQKKNKKCFKINHLKNCEKTKTKVRKKGNTKRMTKIGMLRKKKEWGAGLKE